MANLLTFTFVFLEELNVILWGYIGAALILLGGLFLTFRSGFVQLRKLPEIIRYIFFCFGDNKKKTKQDDCGTSPLKVFFASMAGCIGVGNVVTIAVAIQVGGPGALVWIWAVAFLGMVLKYSEIYLGLKYRRKNNKKSYDGGPMYFLKKAFPGCPLIASFMSILMCIYGVEIYMFNVVKEVVVVNWGYSPLLVTIFLIFIILLSVSGGVKRIGEICGILIPFFVLIFLIMICYIVFANLYKVPDAMVKIFSSAFTGHAAIGGFAGSGFMLTVSKGVSTASYSGDVGIGYASMIHSEANTSEISKQSGLGILVVFLGTFVVCTGVVLLMVITDVWYQPLKASLMVQFALSGYFIGMNIFMPIFIFVLGFTTIISYMAVGIKSVKFIFSKYGEGFYYIYAVVMFFLFSFIDSTYALTIMNIAGGALMIINLPAILILHKKISFKL